MNIHPLSSNPIYNFTHTNLPSQINYSIYCKYKLSSFLSYVLISHVKPACFFEIEYKKIPQNSFLNNVVFLLVLYF